MSKKKAENYLVCSRVWTADALQNHVAPQSVSSHLGERQRYAARILRWSDSRVRDLWSNYQGRYQPSPEEVAQIENKTGLRFNARHELSENERLIIRAQSLLDGNATGSNRALAAALRALLGASDRT